MSSRPIVFFLNFSKPSENTTLITDPNNRCMKACCDAFQIFDDLTPPETNSENKTYVVIYLHHLDKIDVNFIQEDRKIVDQTGVNDKVAVVSCIIDSLLYHLDGVGCVGKDRVEAVIPTQQKELRGFVQLKKKDQYPEYDPNEGKVAKVYADIRPNQLQPNHRILIKLNDGSPETVGKIREEFKKLFREGPPAKPESEPF